MWSRAFASLASIASGGQKKKRAGSGGHSRASHTSCAAGSYLVFAGHSDQSLPEPVVAQIVVPKPPRHQTFLTSSQRRRWHDNPELRGSPRSRRRSIPTSPVDGRGLVDVVEHRAPSRNSADYHRSAIGVPRDTVGCYPQVRFHPQFGGHRASFVSIRTCVR